MVGDVASFALFLAIALFLFLPKPRASIEPVGTHRDSPITVDFNVSGRRGTGCLVLIGVVRFRNVARRHLPLVGRALPRLAERKFGAELRVERTFPDTIEAGDPSVGLGMKVAPVQSLNRLSDGAEQSLVLSAGALFDYRGDVDRPISCRVSVAAEQRTRVLWLFSRRRRLQPVATDFLLRAIPEEPSVEGRFVGGRSDHSTGDVGRRPFPADAGVSAWLTVPHTRGRREIEPDAAPDLFLELRNATRRAPDLRRRLARRPPVPSDRCAPEQLHDQPYPSPARGPACDVPTYVEIRWVRLYCVDAKGA